MGYQAEIIQCCFYFFNQNLIQTNILWFLFYIENMVDLHTDVPNIIGETIFKSKTFLVLGGNLAFRRDAEILDFSNTSTVCTKPANIPDKFAKSAVGAYIDRKVMLCGGWLAGKDCAEYEFMAQQWHNVPYSLNIERAEAAGAMLPNGSWMIIGGKGPDAEPLFSTDFLNKNSLFEPNLQWPEAISGHCMEILNSSHIFVNGGEGKGGKLLDSIYFLNVDTSFWLSPDEKMLHKRRGHVCGITNYGGNEYIVISGGEDNLRTELFDMKTMRFKPGPDLPFEMDWAGSIQFDSSFVIVGGKHIGYCSKGGMCISSNSLFDIDIENNTWKAREQSMKLPRSNHIVLRIGDEDISDDLCQNTCPNCKG